MDRRTVVFVLAAVLAVMASVGLGAAGVSAQDWQVVDLRADQPLGLVTRQEVPTTVSYGPTIISSPSVTSSTPGYPAATYPTPASYPGPNYAAPAISYDARAVSYRSAVPQYVAQYVPQYAPQYVAQYVVPAVAYRPAVAQYTVPVVGYSAAVPVSTLPYVAYSPTPVAAATGPKVIVKPKIVYVEGQPIRNLLRNILP